MSRNLDYNTNLNIKYIPSIKVSQNRLDRLNIELINLWASDFRTHTTENKFIDFNNKLGSVVEESTYMLQNALSQITIPKGKFILINTSNTNRKGEIFF